MGGLLGVHGSPCPVIFRATNPSSEVQVWSWRPLIRTQAKTLAKMAYYRIKQYVKQYHTEGRNYLLPCHLSELKSAIENNTFVDLLGYFHMPFWRNYMSN